MSFAMEWNMVYPSQILSGSVRKTLADWPSNLHRFDSIALLGSEWMQATSRGSVYGGDDYREQPKQSGSSARDGCAV